MTDHPTPVTREGWICGKCSRAPDNNRDLQNETCRYCSPRADPAPTLPDDAIEDLDEATHDDEAGSTCPECLCQILDFDECPDCEMCPDCCECPDTCDE